MRYIKEETVVVFILFFFALHDSTNGQSFVLFSNETHINTLLPNASTPIPLIYNLIKAIALDVDFANGHVYWTDVKEKTIKRANIDGNEVRDIISSNVGVCDGIAVEWLTRRLYWTDTTYNFIQVAELNGSNRRTIIDSGLDEPRGIAVYPQANLMYWTDWGSKPKIERASLNGQFRITLITKNIKWPMEITIDYSSNKIIWVDSVFGWIQTADLDGKSRKTLFKQKRLQPFGVSVLGDSIYWTDWVSRGIHKINKNTGRMQANIYRVGLRPMGVTVYDSSRQPPGINNCSNNNGGCSYLCLSSSKGHRCACPTGRQLTSDDKTCTEAPSSFMLIADAGIPAVYKVYMSLPNHNRIIVSVNETTDITYEPRDERIYWIDGFQRNIRRAFLNMSGEEVFASYSVRPESLAIDWLGRHLYWTDAGTRRIEAAELDTRLQTPVIMEGLEKPRGLVLDPPNGHMYWTDWGKKPKIEKANMDGTSRWTLIEKHLQWPNGLAIDNQGNRLYWVDAFHDRIESCDLLGGTRRVEYRGQNIHPFSLAFSKGYVYWSDVKSRSVQKLDIKNRTSVPYVKQLNRPYGVFIYDPTIYKKVKTLCDNENAGCSHLCLIRHKGYTCSCPSGYKLRSDRKTCERAREFLLFTDASAPSFNILPLDGSDSLWTPVFILPETSNPSDFAYDPFHDTIFWTDLNTGTVNYYNMETEEVKFLHRCNVEKPMGIALDWTAGNIYWTDSIKGRIEVSRTDGSMRKVLVKIPNATAIVLNLKQGKIFVSACGQLPKIQVVYMDGTSLMTVVNRGIICPTSLTLDHKSHRIYWLDIERGVLESVFFNGANRVVLYFEQGVFPQGFTLDGFFAFLTDEKRGNVYKIGIDTKFNATMVTGMKKPTTIRYFNTSLLNVSSPCSSDNGGCSELCLLSAAGTVKCACSTGGTLMNDKKSCRHGSNDHKMVDKRILLIADMSYQDIFKVPLDTKRFSCISIYGSETLKSTSYPVKATPASITYNPRDKFLYWTDVKQRAVMRGSKDGVNNEVIARTGVVYPDGIDVDHISGNVYWTDAVKKKIEVSKLDGSNRKTLIGWSLSKPGAIVVDPIEGRMYWTDYSSKPRIETSHMDGSNRKTLIGTNLKRPTGLAIDFKLRKLYWADKGTGKIESISLSGENRVSVYDISQGNGEKRAPFGLAFNRGKLYWADVLTSSVYQLEIATGNLEVVVTGLYRPVDVRVVGQMDFDIGKQFSTQSNYSNQCSQRNGDCSNLCLPLPAPPGRKCACPEGVTLSDEDKTTCNGVKRCPRISRLGNGKVDSNCQNIPGGLCNVSCNTGYELDGEVSMRCLDNGSWTAKLPTCRVITCFPPLKPKYGYFNLDVCNNDIKPVEYGVTCEYRCNATNGFIREGPDSTTCQSNGMWTMSSVPASCKDIEPPCFRSCPDNIVIETDPGKATALVNWTIPEAHDNADMMPSLTVIPSKISPPHSFPSGLSHVVYTATDTSDLKRSCSFSIEVLDKEAPKVIECQKNFTFMTKKSISHIYLPGVKFSDNVGVTKVDFGNGTKVAWGFHHVTVKAHDRSGNTAACKIDVLVYSYRCKIEKPLNGFKSCSTWRNGGIYCTIGCNHGYAFTQELKKLYFCSDSERWINLRKYADGIARFPRCSRIIGFTELLITGEFSYETEKCLDSAILQGIENKISQLLKKYIISSLTVCLKKGSCTVGEIKILCNPKRSKRQTFNNDLKAKFDIRVYLKKEATAADMNATRNEIKAIIKHGINSSSLSMNIGRYEFKLNTKRGLHVDKIKGICSKGQIYWNEQCDGEWRSVTGDCTTEIKELCGFHSDAEKIRTTTTYNNSAKALIPMNCPIGHYHNVSKDSCEMCPVDSYQDKEGQVTCTTCKKGLSTLGLQSAYTNKQCRECTDIQNSGPNNPCEQWKENGECDENKPNMFKLCPKTCGFCSSMVKTNPTQSRKQRGINLKAVIPALVVPTVIVVAIVLLVVLLLRRKRRRRTNKGSLALDMMLNRKVAIDKPNSDSYKYGVPVKQLHVRFEDKKNKKKNSKKTTEGTRTITNMPNKKPVLKKDKKSDEDDLYVKIPLKKLKVTINDKKRKKRSLEDISEQISTSLELQEINAQMDATQV